MLMIDKIVEMKGSESAIGIKNVSNNEPFFQGHFPGHPVMPGVLIVEAMAQTAGALVLSGLGADAEGKIVYFMTIERAKLPQACQPGDVLQDSCQQDSQSRSRLEVQRRSEGGRRARRGSRLQRHDRRSGVERMTNIHPTAIVDPKAELDPSVKVGPYSIIGPDVKLGADVVLHSHVVIAGRTSIGARTQDISLRLDRPAAAGSQISRRAEHA